MAYTDKQLEQLWEKLGDIPFNEVDCCLYLENDWLEFEAGTEREEIWHWFDERYSKGVHALMFPSEHEQETKAVGVCNRCGHTLYPSEVEGYKYQCFYCDEDFYGFEQE